MNTFNRFIITALLVFFASQAFAVKPAVIKVERTGVTTLTITHSQPIKRLRTYSSYSISIVANGKVYAGKARTRFPTTLIKSVTAVNPNADGYASIWNMAVRELAHLDADGVLYFTNTDEMWLGQGNFVNSSSVTLNRFHRVHDFSLCYQDCILNITSTDTLSVNEGTSVNHTLVSSEDNTTFSLTENTGNLFSLTGATLTFNGTTADFESNTKSYTVKVKATTGYKKTEQIITVNLNDLNDETPAAITFTGNLNIVGNTAANTNLGTLSATDADAGDTLTYTLTNNNAAYFAISGNTLKLAKTVDYQTTKNLSITVRVTDTNSHTLDKNFTFTITNPNINSPTDITLSMGGSTDNHTIAENTATNTNLGTLSTTDADTGDTFTYTLVNNSEAYFSINGNTLKLAKTVDYETTKNLSITVKVTDANSHTFDKTFTFNITDVNDETPSDITSTGNLNIAENTTVNTNLVTLSATDADVGDTFTYTLVNNSAAYFAIDGNTLKLAKTVDYETTKNLNITVRVTDANSHTFDKAFTFNIANVNDETPSDITLTGSLIIAGNTAANTDLGTLSTIDADDGDTFTYTLENNSAAYFAVDGNMLKLAKTVDYETTKSLSITVRVTDNNSHTFDKNFTFTITVPNSNNNSPTDIILSIGNSTDNHTIAENTAANTDLGTLSTTDADTGDTFTYTLVDNSAAYFAISGNTLKLAKTVDYETTKSLSITVKVTDANSHIFSKGFDFAITDIDDTAPTDIQLSNKTLVKGQAADTLIGTLSANDVDTATLSFSVSDTTNFKIDGDKLKTKISIDTVGNMNINITADDGTNAPATQAFTIAVITNIPDITPVIKQFTVTQGNNQGRVISKTGGVVTVHATVIAKTYEWSSVDVTDTSASGDTVFVFDPANTDAGILTITLKATTNTHSSERVLKLELIAESVSNDDDDGDGISNNKDNNTAINKIQAGAGKTITSPTNTRILLGAMGEDSSRLTLAQMQQYITDNNLPNKSNDTLTTGDIYDYVVEGLSAGAATVVIVELTTAIPANAELRRYSLVTGWANFEVNTNNTIHSKTSTNCTDNSTWKAGLTTGATCLRLTIKDGGANDTDGEQADNTGDANGVVASTISITVPDLEDPMDPPSSGGSSGGGCVYNPNAPARFDMGFILLMVLSAYYLIRRKRRFV